MTSIEEANAIIGQEVAKRDASPLGTIGFRLASKGLSDPHAKGGMILDVANRSQVFRLEREPMPRVAFYHWSPGTSSRCASVDVAGMKGTGDVQILMTWSPQETGLCIIPIGQPEGSERWAKGVACQRQFRVTRKGTIIQIGDYGVDILEPRIFEGNELVLEPTAQESWQGVVTAAEILLSGHSEQGHMFKVVQVNSVLTGLVTGFERYCKKRFVELEAEGITPNLEKLIEVVARRSQSAEQVLKRVLQEAAEGGITAVQQMIEVENLINFQDFDTAKAAYNKAYNLKFGEIGAKGHEIDRLRTFLGYRHRIIHVSPLITPLNEPLTGGKEPEFPNEVLAREAIEVFSNFRIHLHKATLKLGISPEKS